VRCFPCALGFYEDKPFKHTCGSTPEVDRRPIWSGEMLTDALRGIYTKWTHFSDGSVESEEFPRGWVIVAPIFWMALLFCAGCSDDEFIRIHEAAKTHAGRVGCYSVTEPKEISGRYCIEYMPQGERI
jgi:hypothetical protein